MYAPPGDPARGWRTWDERSALALTVGLVSAVAVYLAWLVVRPFLGVMTWSLVLAVVFWPVHRRVRRHVSSPSIAALISTLALLLTLVLPATGLAVAVVEEAKALTSGSSGEMTRWLDPGHPTTGRVVRWIEQYVSLDALRSRGGLGQALQARGQEVAERTLAIVGGALGAVVQLVLVLFSVFFLFRDGDRFWDCVHESPVMRRPEAIRLVNRTREVVEASVMGTLAVAAVQGALGGVAFAVLGLASPVLWGTVMALLAIVPTLGAFVVWIPAAVYLLATGAWVKALLLTLWGTFVIGLADNVLRPALVGSRARMHELLVFFGVLGGIEVFGLLGVVMGPVVLATLVALLTTARNLIREYREASETNVPLVTTG